MSKRKKSANAKKTKGERKPGPNLTQIFRDELRRLRIDVKEINEFESVNLTSKKLFSVNKKILYICHDNSSHHNKFKRFYWGITQNVLKKLPQVPESYVLFLGGRNISLEDRQKLLLINDLSPEGTIWIKTILLEYVFIFPSNYLWTKIRNMPDLKDRTNLKFSFYFNRNQFALSPQRYFVLTMDKLKIQFLNNYEILKFNEDDIKTLRGKFKPYFSDITEPWRVWAGLSPKLPNQKEIEASKESLDVTVESSQKEIEDEHTKMINLTHGLADVFHFLSYIGTQERSRVETSSGINSTEFPTWLSNIAKSKNRESQLKQIDNIWFKEEDLAIPVIAFEHERSSNLDRVFLRFKALNHILESSNRFSDVKPGFIIVSENEKQKNSYQNKIKNVGEWREFYSKNKERIRVFTKEEIQRRGNSFLKFLNKFT